MAWLRFWAGLLPDLVSLARALFERHEGDVEGAKLELRAFKNHGAQLDEFEIELQKRMAKLKAQEGSQ